MLINTSHLYLKHSMIVYQRKGNKTLKRNNINNNIAYSNISPTLDPRVGNLYSPVSAYFLNCNSPLHNRLLYNITNEIKTNTYSSAFFYC